MLTVKEFKDLGVEFVVGDFINSAGAKGQPLKSCGADYCSSGSNDSFIVYEFAWRPLNTLPDNPKFKYELKGNNRNIVTFTGEQDLSLTNDKSSNGAYFAWECWRPTLSQSKTIKSRNELTGELKVVNSLQGRFEIHDNEVATSKPAFTQEMADNGELPPMGSDVLCSGILCVCIGYYCDEIVLWNTVFKKYSGAVMSNIKPVDTRTPKQKAVDEALGIIGYIRGGNMESSLNKIYDLWIKKC